MNKFPDLTSLTVYLGSGGKAPDIFKRAAKELGQAMAKRKTRVIYGGMDAGLMGVLAQSALDAGGDVLGVIPTSIRDRDFVQQTLLETNRMIIVDGMWERKKILVDEGQAALALPGGYGTVDEVFEFLYWGQKGFHDKPIGLLNIDGYWSPLVEFLEAVYKAGELEKSVYDHLLVEEDIDTLLDRLAQHNRGRDAAPLRGTETHISEIEEGNLANTQEPVIIDDASIESLYRLANALVLKQLSKITRAIGVIDDDRLFAGLKLWIYTAATQRFITPYCPDMVVFADSRQALDDALRHHIHVSVDLHEKWEGNHAKPHLVREQNPDA